MATTKELQGCKLLMVSSDDLAQETFTTAVKELGGDLLCEPQMTIAAQRASRTRIDGALVDADSDDALSLIRTLRSHNSSKHAVVFACASSLAQTKIARNAGAHFSLLKPVSYNLIVEALSVASAFMLEAQRKYSRRQVAIPIDIVSPNTRHTAVTANLSETGMAIHTPDQLEPGSALEFSFNLPGGGNIEGLGQVVWNDSNGRAGINFEVLVSAGYPDLPQWLAVG